jgi:hypothetical protein
LNGQLVNAFEEYSTRDIRGEASGSPKLLP